VTTVFETSAGGIVYKKEHDIFLWLVVKHKGAGHWGFPKGHIGDNHENESSDEASLREVREEGGVVARIIYPSPGSTNYVYKLDSVLYKKTVHYFLMEYVSGNINNHDDEIIDAKFFAEEELMKTLTFENDKKAFKKLKLFVKI